MKVLFYVPFINRKSGGIFNYAQNVLKELTELSSTQVIVYGSHDFISEIKLDNSKVQSFLYNENFYSRFIRYINHFLSFIYFHFKLRIKFQDQLERILVKEKVDIIYSPYQYFPFTQNKVSGFFTLHDIQELIKPQNFSLREKIIRNYNIKTSIRHSDKVLCSYHQIKLEILKHLKLKENDVYVTGIPLRTHWITNQFRNINQNKGRFILYPSGTWPHKNHINLIKAFNNLALNEIKLVFTGPKTIHYKALNDFIEKNEIKNIEFLGIVDDETLYNLYKQAELVIVPSIYEAGSFPLYEAIYTNTLALSSNIPALSEILQNTDQTFDPNSIRDIQNTVIKFLSDKKLKAQAIKNQERLKLHYFGNAFSNSLNQLINND